jgi:hypothetical protein
MLFAEIPFACLSCFCGEHLTGVDIAFISWDYFCGDTLCLFAVIPICLLCGDTHLLVRKIFFCFLLFQRTGVDMLFYRGIDFAEIPICF